MAEERPKVEFLVERQSWEQCVAKPCFRMGLTNDKGKFSPMENFDQVLHSRHVHSFVLNWWKKTTHAHLATEED